MDKRRSKKNNSRWEKKSVCINCGKIFKKRKKSPNSKLCKACTKAYKKKVKSNGELSAYYEYFPD